VFVKAVARWRADRVREGRWRHHDAAITLEAETARLPPTGAVRTTRRWLGDLTGQGFSMRVSRRVRCPRATSVLKAIYEHRLGSGASAAGSSATIMRKYWCSVERRGCGRFAVLYKWTSARQRRLSAAPG
jgi:hypothetical protein